ncbi:6-hydroxy-D-nicotine oxidase [Nocardia otitidiscaviarum]|uniref:6-hydroxy-D-nicotine oxidase n=1 Tax=Nocardia otitidiscaviarum TaxID=1823 RepID=A0A378Y6J3_9NOCA|nr:FAD-binding protein [Nocardia otitidiscaviarum]SUA72835.1 6-hydroxy-D-nicotine oxidase [Nocardia otitidiscaviarum]
MDEGKRAGSTSSDQATSASDGVSQALVFDHLVKRYELAYSDRPEQTRAAVWLAERLGVGARVLDVGCGSGVPTARQLVDAGIQVVGIDISPVMISAAAAAVPEAALHTCDVLEFTEIGFDGAVAFFSLLMLPRSGIQQALAVLHKAVKPGGYLLVGMVEADLDAEAVSFLDTDVRVSGYRRDDLHRVVEQAGFTVLELRVVSYTPALAEAELETHLYVYAQRPRLVGSRVEQASLRYSSAMTEVGLPGATRDFGGLVSRTPSRVVRPAYAAEIADLVRDSVVARAGVAVVARGCGHSSRGESLTEGIAVDMRGMARVHEVGEDRVVVDAGATWREVLEATLQCGRMPPVLTDYLDLTVGGTLSAAGIGGTSHIHGTQAANVLELEAVTPAGEIVTCSPRQRSQLFDALRSGMGRHGIITKAALRLTTAPKAVLSCRVQFASAAELIAAQGRIHADFISGQVKSSGFELKAVVYDASGPPQGLAPIDVEELAFEDFADRMRPDVEKLIELGEWDCPHPWGQVIVPAAQAAKLVEATLAETSPADIGLSGVILIKRFSPGPVPMLRAPSDAVLFALLRTASPGCATAAQMTVANDQLYDRAEAVGGAPYPPRPTPAHSR